MTTVVRPDASEYPSAFAGYVATADGNDVLKMLERSGSDLASLARGVSEERGNFRYAEGKWTIKTVLGHVIDAERIFTYRALRLARNDQTALPGFDENLYAATAGSDARTVASLADEFSHVRESTVRLFASLPDEAWDRGATVSSGRVTVRALAYITAGHGMHHERGLRERYGV